MRSLKDCHRRAMDFAAQGFMAQMGVDPSAAIPLFEQALELELAAIAELREPVEPTYSVLHRSAGWMAIHCRQFRKAEQLASKALASNPPPDIAAELRDILEHIHGHHHTGRKGTALSGDELQADRASPERAAGSTPPAEPD